MNITISTEGRQARIVLNGRFDFNAHGRFTEGYDPVLRDAKVSELEVDMAEVSYLDSAALGMLLLLNERAKLARKKVTLANCRGIAAQSLKLANFADIFTIR